MPATTGMKGAGFYDQHSTAQQASIRLVFDWIEDAVASMPLPPPSEPFTVLDLGSSEGRNALLAMNAVVDSVRRRQAGQLIRTIYSDLPSNNFNRLFTNLHESRTAGELPSEVYPSAAAGSFYEQLVPPGTVHFATAFNALLWLDELPAVPVPDFVVYRRPHPPRPGLHVPPETVLAFSQRAERDLVRFLSSRARELAPGGKLLIVSPGDAVDHRICDGLYDVLNDACLDLIAAGRLDRGRYARLTIPVYFRTVPETLAPLEHEGSPLKGAFAIDRAETLEVPTPFLVEFDRTGDAAALAESCTGFLRAFSEPVVRSALVGADSDPAIIEALYGRVRDRLKAEPERYRFRYLLTCTLFTRR
jgi:gibberellin A4 carboxyl methyltransferase